MAVFEFNAGNHAQRRALANALVINALERDGRVPVATSANALQPDGQNDNGWDQGLLFLNPARVWLQPPGWVTRMVARNYQPWSVPVAVAPPQALDVSAKRSEDGRTVVLQVVNAGPEPVTAELVLADFKPRRGSVSVEGLAGPLDAVNTATQPNRWVPQRYGWRPTPAAGNAHITFPAQSFTILRFD